MANGKIKFVKRGGAVVATLSEADLGAREYGTPAIDPMQTLRQQELDMPHSVSVVYINQDADYQQGTQKSDRMTGGGVNVLTIPLPIAMTDQKAKQVADVNQYLTWHARTKYSFPLSSKWRRLEPTDVIDVPYNGSTLRMRITKKDEGKPGIVKIEADAEDSAIYTQSGSGAGSSNIPVQTVDIPVQTLAMFMDIPMLRDEDNAPGFYFAACGYRSGWKGCTIFKSTDAGATYSQLISVTDAATIGIAESALADFQGGNVFDELSSVVVELFTGSLSSTTELAVLNGANAFLLGNEICQFKTATLIAANTYRLTGLLRGRRGTEWAMSTHISGDRFVLLDPTTVRRIPLSSSEIGLQRLYKPVSFGMTLQQTAAQALTYSAADIDPYSPVEIKAGRDASNNITFGLTRRNRLFGEWRDYVDVPMSEATESYEIDVYSDSTFTTVLRTLTSTTNSVNYSAANQITDFGYVRDWFYLKVYQLSAISGRGFPATVSIKARLPLVTSDKWRVWIDDTQLNYVNVRLAEVEMRGETGGADLCTGGTASASGGTAAAAFDNDTGTVWDAGVTVDGWIQYTFASPVAIKEIGIAPSGTYSAPLNYKFEYYNGSAWVPILIVTGDTTWSIPVLKSITVQE